MGPELAVYLPPVSAAGDIVLKTVGKNYERFIVSKKTHCIFADPFPKKWASEEVL